MDMTVCRINAPSRSSGKAGRRFFSWMARVLPFCALALGASLAAFAGCNEWTTNGPYGGSIKAIAVDPVAPDTLYAGTWGGGVYKSTDGGNSWMAASSGLAKLSISDLVIDPQTPSTVYAGIGFGGVYKSVDHGGSWVTANDGLTNTWVNALAIDPMSLETVYAGTANGGVFKTINGGKSWAAVNNGLPANARNVLTLSVDPQTTTTLYAGTLSGGVCRSQDGGTSWAAINDGLPADASVWAFAIDPSNPATLYAGTNGDGLFKSTDGGGSWTSVGDAVPPWVFSLAVDPREPAIVYAGTRYYGVFKSTGGGAQTIQEMEDGGYFVAGASVPTSPNGYGLFLRLDSEGAILWSKALGDNLVSWWPMDSAWTAEGNLIIVGDGSTSMWLLLMDAEGAVGWQYLYGRNGGYVFGESILPSSDGGYLLTANLGDLIGGYDGWLLKVDALGNVDDDCDYMEEAVAPEVEHEVVVVDGVVQAGYLPQETGSFTLVGEATGIDTPLCLMGCTITCFIDAFPESGKVPLRVSFYGSESSRFCMGDSTFEWSFGDGAISQEEDPVHVYESPGTYTCSLQVAQGEATATADMIIQVDSVLSGDCNRNGVVTIGEVQRVINMFLSISGWGCSADCDKDYSISIGEVQRAIDAFLGLNSSCFE